MNVTMDTCVDDFLAHFLESSGLLVGRIPAMHTIPVWMEGYFVERFHTWFPDDNPISLVEEPIHAVCLKLQQNLLQQNLIEGKNRTSVPTPVYVGGISFGMRRHFPTLLPDVLLGFVDDIGIWHWAGGNHGEVFNLHALDGDVTFPDRDAWPVWFTFGDHAEYRTDLITSKQTRIDIYESRRRRACATFWKGATYEFIATTWAPHRLPWCLDHEEYAELFSDEATIWPTTSVKQAPLCDNVRLL